MLKLYYISKKFRNLIRIWEFDIFKNSENYLSKKINSNSLIVLKSASDVIKGNSK